jgi:hypothetical protein
VVYRAESQRRFRVVRVRNWASEPPSLSGMKIPATILHEYCREGERDPAQGCPPEGYATMLSLDTGTTSTSSKLWHNGPFYPP